MQDIPVKVVYLPQSTPYPAAVRLQEETVDGVHRNHLPEHLFFAEHAPVFTCGTSADKADLLNIGDIPALSTGRGGKVTYHGPGQRVLYPVLNLQKNEAEKDVRAYVRNLQQWMIETLAHFDIAAHGDGEVGVWVPTAAGDKKIAAIGVRVRRWVTFHGVALNIQPEMEHFRRIVPCGITTKGVTSMAEQGFLGTMDDVDTVLKQTFTTVFGRRLLQFQVNG